MFDTFYKIAHGMAAIWAAMLSSGFAAVLAEVAAALVVVGFIAWRCLK